MGRVRHRKSQRRVVSFLNRTPLSHLDWLERIGPEYTWVLRHLYSPVPCTAARLAEIGPWAVHLINSKRDQGLYLLGYRFKISAKSQRIADHIHSEFEIRQRLVHVRDTARIGPGDKEVIRLALEFGSCSYEIARNSTWTQRTLLHALNRLAGLKPMQWIQPGALVRQAACRELFATGENPKQELELQILEALSEELGIVELAAQWEVPQVIISALTIEIRRELAAHSSTRVRYAALDRERRGRKDPSGGCQIKWLNAQLLPLYKTFRKAADPFSARERKYLRLRIKGTAIGTAAREAFGVPPWKGSAIDRALMREVLPVRVTFPKVLPLPPFTSKQRELMQQLRYAQL